MCSLHSPEGNLSKKLAHFQGGSHGISAPTTKPAGPGQGPAHTCPFRWVSLTRSGPWSRPFDFPIMPCTCVCFASSNLQRHIPQHRVFIWFDSSLRPSNLLHFKDVLISLILTGLFPAPVGRGRFQLASRSPAANALAQALLPDV